MIEKKLCLLVNPYAARGQTIRAVKKVEATFKRLKANFYTVLTDDVPEAQKIAQDAANKGEYIIVLGGDGSLRVIAEKLQYTKAVISILPCGRGNDFARTLKIPLNLESACEALVNGVVELIDMAQVNGKPYLGICSAGLDSVANDIANRTHFISGRAIYLYAGLVSLMKWKPAQFYLELDGIKFDFVGYTVAVANSKCYGGGMMIAPHSSLTDGFLDIVLIENIKKSRMLLNFSRVFRGTHIYEPGFKIIRARHVRIDLNPKLTMFADGDPIATPPAEIQVLPKALHFLVPRG